MSAFLLGLVKQLLLVEHPAKVAENELVTVLPSDVFS